MLIGVADRIEITILMDNYADILLPSTDMVERRGLFLRKQLVAEHGLSMLITVYSRGQKRNILMDAGFTEQGVLWNAEALGVDLGEVDAIFLSHGHLDHYAALMGVLGRVKSGTPLFAHPDAFLPKHVVLPQGEQVGPWLLNKKALEEAGVRVFEAKTPVTIASGLSTTGEIERTTAFEKVPPIFFTVKDGVWQHDQILDDQALVARLGDEGLVVIAGCAHSGIVNTIRHAQKISGVDKVFAVLGGFHLATAPKDVVGATIAEIASLKPKLVMPMHCTGFHVISEFAHRIPESFVLSSVGSVITLEA